MTAHFELIPVQVPLPFPLKAVNAYLLRGGIGDSGGWTLIDPGIHTADAERMWEETLAARGIRFADIEQIVLTHYHPDHYGLAGWFQERSGAPVFITETGGRLADRLWGEGTPLTADMVRSFVRHGMDEGLVAEMTDHMDGFVPLVSPRPQVTFLDPQRPFRMGGKEWRPVETPGHAAGHLCFYEPDSKTMLCGDHVLPKITPNVGYLPGAEEDPLRQYLRSLEKAAQFDVSLAYPGHRDPIADFAGRARELIAHHRERLDTMTAMLTSPKSGYAVCRELFGDRLSLHQFRFAMAETVAHLIYLRNTGRVDEREQDGMFVYTAAR